MLLGVLSLYLFGAVATNQSSEMARFVPNPAPAEVGADRTTGWPQVNPDVQEINAIQQSRLYVNVRKIDID
jgi:hypothetical protein